MVRFVDDIKILMLLYFNIIIFILQPSHLIESASVPRYYLNGVVFEEIVRATTQLTRLVI